jgi:hypothetical protein
MNAKTHLWSRWQLKGYTFGHGPIGRKPYKAVMVVANDLPVKGDEARTEAHALLSPVFPRYELS